VTSDDHMCVRAHVDAAAAATASVPLQSTRNCNHLKPMKSTPIHLTQKERPSYARIRRRVNTLVGPPSFETPDLVDSVQEFSAAHALSKLASNGIRTTTLHRVRRRILRAALVCGLFVNCLFLFLVR
jgi:hypothetical protein